MYHSFFYIQRSIIAFDTIYTIINAKRQAVTPVESLYDQTSVDNVTLNDVTKDNVAIYFILQQN